MIVEGTVMLSYQPCGDKVNFFRMVFSNPATRQTDVDYLIDEIQRLGKDLWFGSINLNTECKNQLEKSIAEDNNIGLL